MAYSDKETAAVEAVANENGSVTYAQAVELADELGKSPRSVIAKIKQLDLPYVPKPKAAPKRVGPTKAELVAQVEANLDMEEGALAGLTKATASALGDLVDAT